MAINALKTNFTQISLKKDFLFTRKEIVCVYKIVCSSLLPKTVNTYFSKYYFLKWGTVGSLCVVCGIILILISN